MERIRGGRGLGDAIYLRPIAEHFVRAGTPVSVLSDFDDVFIGSGASVEPFSRTNGANIVAHYVHGKTNPGTTQWQDVCRSARVEAELRFSWTVRNTDLIDRLTQDAGGRPMILVHGGRAPMGRTDGFGMELLPDRHAFEAALDALSDCYLVQVGKAPQIYALPVSVDLNGTTSVSDLLDVASVCAGVVAQCSFAIPLAEVFEKPLLAIWSARAARSESEFIRVTTPQKVLSGPRDSFVVDCWPHKHIREVAREFRLI
jgi:hypothetical protein